LFEDLQADFRQETHLKAEDIRLIAGERMSEKQRASDLKLNKVNQNN
jgi:hypothetical protein